MMREAIFLVAPKYCYEPSRDMPNICLEDARCARPTRKSDALLLAAQAGRYISPRKHRHVCNLSS